MSVVVSRSAKGAITTTDIIISDLPDDIVAALDKIAERVAMTREDFIAGVLFREASRPVLTEAEYEKRLEELARLARLLHDDPAVGP